RLSRHRHPAGQRGACRRLQPRPRHHLRLHRRRVGRRPADRPALPAARPAREGVLTMRAVLGGLLRRNRAFAAGTALLAIVVVIALMSFFAPTPPIDTYVVPPDVPPSWAYPLGTNSRGQDVFWQLSAAIRNTLLFGITVAAISRCLSLLIGMVAGYAGGIVDRALMSLNDTFIVIPLFPILVLVYFVLRDRLSWVLLALVMAGLGWAYDARLIRSVAISLRNREFTDTARFSGMNMRQILVSEHLPYVLPIIFSTTMNNIN